LSDILQAKMRGRKIIGNHSRNSRKEVGPTAFKEWKITVKAKAINERIQD